MIDDNIRSVLVEAMAQASYENVSRVDFHKKTTVYRDAYIDDASTQLTALIAALPSLGLALVPTMATDAQLVAAWGSVEHEPKRDRGSWDDDIRLLYFAMVAEVEE